MIDWLVRNALIVDGTGAPPFRGSVSVSGERVTGVGEVLGLEAKRVIEADGKVVCPGFIDMHSHSDLLALNGSSLIHKIYQGVTAELVGQDGMSAAPLTETSRNPMAEMLEPLAGALNGEWPCWDLGEYVKAVERRGTPINAMTLVGHCNLRLAVMGYQMGLPTPEQTARMEALLAMSLKQGAMGLSLGLIYPPSSYSDVNELIGLGRVVQAHDAIFVAHIRNEDAGVFEALDEMIRVGRESGCRIHISHLKCMGKDCWGRMPEVLGMLERAVDSGVDVSFDQYPYTAACTSLSILLPGWALEGGWKGFSRRVLQADALERMRTEIGEKVEGRGGARSVTIASVRSAANRKWVGRSLEQISAEKGMPSDRVVLDLLTEEELQVVAIYHAMSEGDVELAMTHPLHTVGSDGILAEFPHPRTYGTFPRVIRHYSRERGLFGLEKAVQKMTSGPAGRLGLKDRGKLAPGYFADMLLFAPETFRDAATFENPKRLAQGLDWVFVNGVPLIEDGKMQESLPGKVIARG